jgi:hypothetical protein
VKGAKDAPANAEAGGRGGLMAGLRIDVCLLHIYLYTI